MLPTTSACDERDEVLYCSPPLLWRRSATPPARCQRAIPATPSPFDRYVRSRLIRSALLDRGQTLSSVARSIDVSPSAVSRVLSGRMRSRRIEDALTHILDLDQVLSQESTRTISTVKQQNSSTAAER